MSNDIDVKYTKTSPDVTILDPKVIVFHNVVSDCGAYIDFYKESLQWNDWYGFGDKAIVGGGGIQTEDSSFPTLDEWTQKIVNAIPPGKKRDPYKEELAKAFYHASKFYIEHTGHTQPNWLLMPWDVAKYTPDLDSINPENLTMNYHTDYILKDADSPGNKFGITAVFYPNDDYAGGEISFRLIEDFGVLAEFDYKPRAGDLVIFPSRHPYYHGVRKVTGSAKYITRIYWMYEYEGSSDWHELNAKYGPEKFAELEHQRLKNTNLMLMLPYMRPMFTLKEYYNLLESGQLASEVRRRHEENNLD